MTPGVDHIGVSVCFVCYDGLGRVLLHQRSEECRDEKGRWCFGAGQVEFGETLEGAVRREVREEYGIGLDLCSGNLSPHTRPPISQLMSRCLIRESDGRPTHWLQVYHAVRLGPVVITTPEPTKVLYPGWYYLDRLPSPLSSNIDVALLRILVERGIACGYDDAMHHL